MTEKAALTLHEDRPLLGMALMLGFCVMIPLGDALAKLLSTRVSVSHIVFARFAVQALILFPLALILKRPLALPKQTWGVVLVRTLLQMAGISAMFLALRHLPLADAVAIAFVMPFFMLLLGRFVLKEDVGPHRLFACCIGFIGTLLVVQPSFVSVGYHALWPLAVAVIFAVFMLVTRKISRDVDPIALQAVSGCLATLIMAPLFLISFSIELPGFLVEMPSGETLQMLGLAGLLGTFAHLLMTWSLRFAPTSTLASMQYIEIPCAVLVGWFFFAELPNSTATYGICVTVLAGLYAIWRETRNKAQRAVA